MGESTVPGETGSSPGSLEAEVCVSLISYPRHFRQQKPSRDPSWGIPNHREMLPAAPPQEPGSMVECQPALAPFFSLRVRRKRTYKASGFDPCPFLPRLILERFHPPWLLNFSAALPEGGAPRLVMATSGRGVVYAQRRSRQLAPLASDRSSRSGQPTRCLGDSMISLLKT